MIFWCALAIAAYLFYKWGTASFDYFEKRGVPFSKPIFLLGSYINMVYDRKSLPDAVIKWYNEDKLKHEKVSGIFEFRKPVYFIRDPKIAKLLAIKNFDHFVDHRVVLDEQTDKLFGRVLINLKGQKWRDMRSTLSPMFTGSKMRLMFDNVSQVGKQISVTLKQQIRDSNDESHEFRELCSKFTIDVIATAAFGIQIDSLRDPNNDFQRIATSVTDFSSLKMLLKIVGYLTIPNIMRIFKITILGKEIEDFFDEAVKDMMRIREEKGIVRHDMINLLIEAKRGNLKELEKVNEEKATFEEYQIENSQSKTIWNDDDLAAQCFLFFFAGFDSVATAMGFMGYELACNAEVQEKLFDEVKSMEEKLDGQAINYDEMQSLTYLDQVVSETLRKWPSASISDRICTKDFEVEYDDKKFTIEKGCSLMIPIHGYHHDPKFFPEPEKFKPERFDEENRKNIDPNTYLPFGLGPRMCIGARFAILELKTIFYYLLLNFSFEVTSKTDIPLKIAPNAVGIKALNGLWIGLKPRD